jgi:hypothetical protein
MVAEGKRSVMLNASGTTTWTEAGVLLALLVVAGFLVSWIATDLGHMARRPYIALLALVAGGMTAAIALSGDVSVTDAVTHNWQRGLVGGVGTGLVLGFGMRKMPATLRRSGRALHTAEAWEGVVYGIAEGLLLSGLPVWIAWQAAVDSGWVDVAGWGAALSASAVMIAIHHFGYWDFRGPQVVPALAACLLLSAAYLMTGSVLAPVVGHVVLHLAAIVKGVALPPHDHVLATSA